MIRDLAGCPHCARSLTLVGQAEIAEMLDVSRQRAHQLTRFPGFPRPVAALAAGRVWNRGDVAVWNGRRLADYPEDRRQQQIENGLSGVAVKTENAPRSPGA